MTSRFPGKVLLVAMDMVECEFHQKPLYERSSKICTQPSDGLNQLRAQCRGRRGQMTTHLC